MARVALGTGRQKVGRTFLDPNAPEQGPPRRMVSVPFSIEAVGAAVTENANPLPHRTEWRLRVSRIPLKSTGRQ
jgi:hypothetical protein